MAICKNCGQDLGSEDSLCHKCGEPASAEAPQRADAAQPDAVPPDTAPPNVSYVSPPPQYGYAPPPNAPPPGYGYAPPPNAPPPGYGYAPPPNAPPPGYGYSAPQYNGTGAYSGKTKSKVVAGLLAILLGYGIYNFYLKKLPKAFIQLAGYLVAIGLIIYWSAGYVENMVMWSMDMASGRYSSMMPAMFSPAYIIGILISSGLWLWQLVEGILIFCGKIDRDGDGNPIV